MTPTISVKNFERFQHYKDRSPPWIKLYNELLEDYDFASLDDVTKGHLMLIWLLASRMDNRLPYDAKWIGNKINAQSPVDLDALADAGFIVPYDDKQARGKREEWPSRYIKDEVRQEVMERAGNRCQADGCRSTENLEIDHVVPISKGGTGAESNLQVLCRSCNRRKRASNGSVAAEQVATQPPSPVEPRERERGRAETEKGTAKAVLSHAFEDFWLAFPKRSGTNSQSNARKKFLILLKSGADPPTIIAGAERYAVWCAAEGKIGSEYVQQATTWLNQKGWENEYAATVNGHGNGKHTINDSIATAIAFRRWEEQQEDRRDGGDQNVALLPRLREGTG